MKPGMYFREFEDGDYEFGLLEKTPNGTIMDVGDHTYFFAFIYNPNWFEQWTWIGGFE